MRFSLHTILVYTIMAMAASCVAASAQARPTAAAALGPPFPDLLPAAHPDRVQWNKLGKDVLWDFLVKSDVDFVGTTGQIVPAAFPGAKLQAPAICGRVARLWIRAPFHDCGTYNAKTKTGGCSGSLRKEIPDARFPVFDPNTNTAILIDPFDNLGQDKPRADYAVDPSRLENSGFSASIAFFFKAKFAAQRQYNLSAASWVDIMIYSGMLGIAICGGPPVLFVPGRVDSSTADDAGLLAPPTASLDELLGNYRRMGFGALDGISAQACHTTACFAAGCLDSTPTRFDRTWAQEALMWRPNDPDALPVCLFNGTSQARCIAGFDSQLVQSSRTRPFMELLAGNTINYRQLQARIAAIASAGDFLGLLQGVNLCDSPNNAAAGVVCPRSQWSFFQLVASSYYRLCNLGAPDYRAGQPFTWDSVQVPFLPDAAAVYYPSDEERRETVAAWQVANSSLVPMTSLPALRATGQ